MLLLPEDRIVGLTNKNAHRGSFFGHNRERADSGLQYSVALVTSVRTGKRYNTLTI